MLASAALTLAALCPCSCPCPTAVSYVFPVTFHWIAYFGRAQYQKQKVEAEAELVAELGGKGDPEAGCAKFEDSASKGVVAAANVAPTSPFDGPASVDAASGKRTARLGSIAQGATPFSADAFPDIPESGQLAVGELPMGR